MGAERRCAIALIVFAVAVGTASTSLLVPGCDPAGPMLVGPGDDSEATTCTQALCMSGSPACCPGGGRGTWNVVLRGCICPSGADADADTPDVPVCTAVTCGAICRDGGFAGGRCSGEVCVCEGRPADADAESDADADTHRGCPPTFAPELGGPCNVVYQCGCAAGERCWIDYSGATAIEACIPTGSEPPGGPCSAGDDCVAGSQCFGIGAAERRCMQFCYEDDDCWDGLQCLRDIEEVPGYRLCDLSVDCDPFTAVGCPVGESCLIMPPTGARECVTAGTLGPGEECTETGQCRIGSGCYSTTGVPRYFCYAYCDLAGTIFHCPPGETCQAALGHDSIGVCMTG